MIFMIFREIAYWELDCRITKFIFRSNRGKKRPILNKDLKFNLPSVKFCKLDRYGEKLWCVWPDLWFCLIFQFNLYSLGTLNSNFRWELSDSLWDTDVTYCTCEYIRGGGHTLEWYLYGDRNSPGNYRTLIGHKSDITYPITSEKSSVTSL